MDKEKHNCDNVCCNHNDTKGVCCLFNPDNCKYRQLQKENEELKDEWQEQVQKATDEGYARTLQTIQLSKAKELLAKWVELFKPKGGNIPPTPIQVETEQFIKDLEK
jgi:hypothetical protein